MLEILTGGSPGASFNPLPILGYNFDQNKSTSGPEATVVTGGVITDISALSPLTGYSKALRLLNVSAAFNQTTALTQLGYQDYTLEGWFWFTALPSNYQTVFQLSWANQDICIQFGDQGFGYRLQSSMYARAGMGHNYNTPQTSQTMLGKWYHLAMVRKKGMVRFYINGVHQLLASGTAATHSLEEYDGAYNLTGGLSTRVLGGTYRTPTDMYVSEVALFTGTKYIKDFTPPVGAIVK